ncbi:MAG: septum formation initiator family protein [Paracoccaceae bacterium]
MSNKSTLPWGMIAGIAFAMALGMYFTFAAVQGDYGLFRRAEILNEAAKLEPELAGLHAEIAALENLTRRMSDDYLDIDLLDQQSRDILGQIRADEIIIR